MMNKTKETKIDEAIEKIKKLAREGNPAVAWVHASADKKCGFGSHYRKTGGPVLPKKEIVLNLTEKEAKTLMEKLAVVSEHSIVFDERNPYGDAQWWSPTNIPGATLHHAIWEGEWSDAKTTFIIVGLPDGVCEDLQEVLGRIQEILEGFSCTDISGLSRDETVNIYSESIEKLRCAEALWEKAQELNAQEDTLAKLKTTINHKKLERLISHELPWRNTPNLISDIRVYVKEIQEICLELQVELPDEVRPFISDYGYYVVSLYEKNKKESNDPLWCYLDYNRDGYKANTTALTGMLEGMKNFIDLAGDDELSQKFNAVEAELLQQWNKKGKRYGSIFEKFKYQIDNILGFLKL